MRTYEVLERALTLIEDERDWHGGAEAWGPGGCRCAGQALCSALDMSWEEADGHPAAIALATAMGDQKPESIPIGGIALANGKIGHSGVVAAYRSAIRAEKTKAGVALDMPMPPIRSSDGIWTEEFTEMERRLGV